MSNVTFQPTPATAPAGTVVATDTITGVDYQRVKVVWGANGVANDANATTPLPVDLTNTGANTTALNVAQSGTWNITNVSGTVSLPTGASTAAKQPALGTAGTASADVITVQGIASMTALKVDPSGVTSPVSGTVTANQGGTWTATVTQATAANLNATVAQSGTWNITNISGTVSLPTGASTAAKQPALGIAGTASSDVITVQGIASMTALKVDGSAVTQPVSISGNQAVNVAQINGATPLMGAGNTGTGSPRVTLSTDQAALAAWGLGATGSAVPSGAQYEAFNAATALPTAATAGNLTGAMSDKFGRQVVNVATIRDLVGTQTTTLSASTAETTIVTAGAAGVFNDLVMLIVSNTSTATNTRIDFRDATAGSILFSLQSNGGQPPIGFALPVPIPQTTAANNWTAQCATSTTDVRIYAVFAKNK